jgi:putative oxidoreductase
MALSRRIARPLLASIFVVGGLDAVRNPEGKAKKGEAASEPLGETAGALPLDPDQLVRINGAVQIGAGVLLATGKFRRLASVALIGSIIPTTYAGHRFWEETDPVTRTQQRMHFLKNLGLLGGLILAAVDTEGEPSLGWRAKRRARQLETVVALGRATSHAKAGDAGRRSKATASSASKTGRRAIGQGNAAGRRAGQRVRAAGLDVAQRMVVDPDGLRHGREALGGMVGESSGTAAHAVQQASSVVAKAARQLEPLAQSATHAGADAIGPYLASTADRTARVLSNVGEHLPE